MRTLLIEMPFKCVKQPNIGLSLVKSAVVKDGWHCDIRYANITFAALTGLPLYDCIVERFPPEMLIGDLIFAPIVRGKSGEYDLSLRHLTTQPSRRQKALCSIPSWFWEELGRLQDIAATFVEALAQEIADSDYDVVGLNATFQTMPSLAFAKLLKQHAPRCHTVLGGAHCEGDMGLALHRNYEWLDFVCRGEGERLLPQLLSHLAGKGEQQLETIQGLVWRQGGRSTFCGNAAARTVAMDDLPEPDYRDWLQQLDASQLALDKCELWLPLETSRGCWWGEKQHCIFCGLNGEAMTFREKSAARVMAELADLSSYGIRNIFGVDLIFPYRYFTTLLPHMPVANHGFRFFFEIKANLSREQLVMLRDAGICSLQPGIESFSSPILKLMRKGISAYQNVRLLKWAAELGIDLEWNLLYGFPGEKPDDYAHIPALIEPLIHLRPPTSGCTRVRIDRFSPLHFDHKTFGISALQPAAPYRMVYGLSDEELTDIAYHFESDLPVECPYIAPVVKAMDRWHAAVGIASFTYVRSDARLFLFDRRFSDATVVTVLEGEGRDVFLACDSGETRDRIISKSGVSSQEVDRLLAEFRAQRWIVDIDSHSLSVAIEMPHAITVAAPELLWPALCHALYTERVLRTWKPLLASLQVSDREGKTEPRIRTVECNN